MTIEHDDPRVARIAALFAAHGDAPYEGMRRESVSAREHALQCAQLAEWAGAPDTLVAACLLHDIGHFLAAEAVARDDQVDDRHEVLALPLLAAAWGDAVAQPVRLHVAAKRYLVRVDARYAEGLSPASRHSLQLQGGPMDAAEADAFETLAGADAAVRLRRWDDLAKRPGRATPPLAHHLALLATLRPPPR